MKIAPPIIVPITKAVVIQMPILPSVASVIGIPPKETRTSFFSHGNARHRAGSPLPDHIDPGPEHHQAER